MYKWTFVLGFLMGCGSDDAVGWEFQEPTPDAVPAPTPEPEPPTQTTRFDGWWRVDQPNHAGYEATAYNFRNDGALLEGESQGYGSGQVPVGRVARCLESASEGQCSLFGVECLFGERWTAEGHVLTITGVCSDGRARDIVLTFQAGDASENLEPHVDVIVGETWMHNDFQWSWTRCESSDLCLAWFR